MIKPIETVYKDYRFRSRLEARWGVFFDTLGIAWEYEKEGYELDGVRYLPDFWLPKQECFVEVKGQEPTLDEHLKASRLAWGIHKRVILLSGNIEIPHKVAFSYEPMLQLCSLGVDMPHECYFTDRFKRRCFGVNTIEYGTPWHGLSTLPAMELLIEAREAGFLLSFAPGRVSFVRVDIRQAPATIEPIWQELQSRLDTFIGEDALHGLSGVWIPINGVAGTLLHCSRCNRLSVGQYDIERVSKCACGGLFEEKIGVEKAYTAARQARFEYGETPRTLARPRPARRIATTKRVASAPPKISQYHAGNVVKHARFGPGVVLLSEMEGNTEFVEVLFEASKYGKKRMSMDYAKLEIIGTTK